MGFIVECVNEMKVYFCYVIWLERERESNCECWFIVRVDVSLKMCNLIIIILKKVLKEIILRILIEGIDICKYVKLLSLC